jgi:omega-amidase
MNVKIAIAQIDITFGNPQKNREKVQQWIEMASLQSPDIIVFPELWDTGYDLSRLEEIADSNGESSIKLLQQLAKKHKIHIVGGSIANIQENGIKNTLIVIDDKGNLVKEYSKLHLFQLMNEHKYLIPGNDDGLFTLMNFPFAAFICYDIRFPEWMRKQVLQGAKALFVVAEWPSARLDHWRSLLITRAIENQCFVIACNRVGSDPNNEFAGHSLIINPWGEVIAEGKDEEELIIQEINLSDVETIRQRIPIFTDRRPEYYN